ncbi:uncharacterized protein LOC112346883 isoform X2 [Selaginella moellendorffii]|uniref:uncharacterized protein LOC112346883 isoform X2 n=1 Tax=Selaginella moellendorffii TaxID=88036 RepID=UPI000D1CC379|nr:uncharacterized protein LOC112346883 isoform X2 [Selaginella moellendorffii]|eukprot:XP_024532489.1 uncharacterized protein LOC112346883 isoform X2 [Selaginella moellendorffii]
MTTLLRARCYSTQFYCQAQESVRRTRREILFLGHGIAAASALSLPSSPSARKLYTNLEEAREAGEARREEKERAQGPIITLPSGIRFRELDAGSGRTVAPGDVVSVQYVIYRLNGMYLDSLGYGNEGKDDVGDVLTFQLGGRTVRCSSSCRTRHGRHEARGKAENSCQSRLGLDPRINAASANNSRSWTEADE